MSISLSVLAPNGRRRIIHANLNTSILQILEDVCKMLSLPESEYCLTHLNKILDRSSNIRFSNISNNAKLELVKRPQSSANESYQENKVTICISLENGDRITNLCNINDTLWDSVGNFHKSETSDLPVCVYMRQELVGKENLKKATFKSLGIISGKALIRFMHRPLSQPSTQPFVEALILSKSNLPASNITEEDPLEQRSDEIKSCELLPIHGEDNLGDELNCEFINTDDVVVKALPEDSKMENEPFVSFINEKRKDFDKIETDLQSEDIIVYLDDKSSVLFSLDDVNSTLEESIPDEFFEVTLADVRFLMADQKRQRKELEELPLQTRAIREAEYFARLKKYPKVVIRINFPDRLVLQGIFKAYDTVKHIEDLVRNFLANKQLEFYLYTTPPKRILLPEETLYEVPLVPTAVVKFGCNESKEHYLDPEIMTKRSSFGGANKSTHQIRSKSDREVQLPIARETQVEIVNVSSLAGVSTDTLPSSPHPREAYESKGAVPKWFTIGKK